MKRILRYRPSPATAIALTALIVAIGGVAYATIPDSSGTIHGCFSNTNGNLRVVESASNCRMNETPIAWNQQGPPGGLTTAFAEEASEVSTASERSFVDLGGPSVTVTVPPSGLVAAVARGDVHGTFRPPLPGGTFGPHLAGCLGLFVDSQPFRGVGELDGSCTEGVSAPTETRRDFLGVRVEWFTFEASPGRHTISLRYEGKCGPADAGCPPEDRAYFRNRKLWVIPIG